MLKTGLKSVSIGEIQKKTINVAYFFKTQLKQIHVSDYKRGNVAKILAPSRFLSVFSSIKLLVQNSVLGIGMSQQNKEKINA